MELCGLGRTSEDEIPWCSAYVNLIAYLLRLPRSKNAAARSWLRIGLPVSITEAEPGFDVVILKRGPDPQPGPDVTQGAPGHVGFYADRELGHVLVLGGNQADSVSIARFPIESVLGVRRIC